MADESDLEEALRSPLRCRTIRSTAYRKPNSNCRAPIPAKRHPACRGGVSSVGDVSFCLLLGLIRAPALPSALLNCAMGSTDGRAGARMKICRPFLTCSCGLIEQAASIHTFSAKRAARRWRAGLVSSGRRCTLMRLKHFSFANAVSSALSNSPNVRTSRPSPPPSTAGIQ